MMIFRSLGKDGAILEELRSLGYIGQVISNKESAFSNNRT